MTFLVRYIIQDETGLRISLPDYSFMALATGMAGPNTFPISVDSAPSNYGSDRIAVRNGIGESLEVQGSDTFSRPNPSALASKVWQVDIGLRMPSLVAVIWWR